MQKNLQAAVEAELISFLVESVKKAIFDGDLDLEKVPEVSIEVPREKGHGDYATNLAMVLAGQAGMNPRQIAEIIVENFESEIVEDVSIAGPGFINFKLKNAWLWNNLKIITKRAEDYGKIDEGKGKSVQVEFVSANPTGPLHVGHSRGAVVGDVMASIMEAAGFDVEREYYINDAGNQMDILGESTLLRYRELLGEEIEMPEDVYGGDYIKEIAQDLYEEYDSDLMDREEAERLEICREYAYQEMLKNIEADLEEFGIEFDSWFSERTLHPDKIQHAIDLLREKGYIYEKEGAIWFKSTEFGDDKDRVIIKSDDSPTYMAADMAYHLDKLERGFDKLINVWGADHHGYIPRMKAVIEAFGYEEDKLEVIVVQMVNLLRNGEKLKMSKRAGSFVTMTEVNQEVGTDAARYYYVMRSTDSHLDFDLELAKEESSNNPVYYVQYAHARIHSILDNAELKADDENLDLLTNEAEIDLMKMLAKFPEEIKMIAESRQPHHLTTFAYDLATAFHSFYNNCRVNTDNDKLAEARLYLVNAARQVLKNVLTLLGISAPEQM
ncbi:Arginyl-tRNA synthetase [Halanaerobium saccharolyticum subsp. saccharolyticum DSM 6643]|uniref:Arginine--tRNA ligase n=1 Tax=Halanaerobium saccharolyticum subsp. saccharolyticum DSM 6643 TaxID=1293054 RepID=M5E1X7_9FIRM|nr:arginine--tRNA ligase [Halanaerobium saccharolyticum]CCU79993.1 Arginyl-tRNA synthetase [Halanaerobium saccharolyticum subsp. saccharolyticum DSM 6643]